MLTYGSNIFCKNPLIRVPFLRSWQRKIRSKCLENLTGKSPKLGQNPHRHKSNFSKMTRRNTKEFYITSFKSVCKYTVEPRYNEVLGTMKITLLYQVSHHIRVKKQRNIKSWDQQNYLVIRGFCYIRPLYNEVPLYFKLKYPPPPPPHHKVPIVE